MRLDTLVAVVVMAIALVVIGLMASTVAYQSLLLRANAARLLEALRVARRTDEANGHARHAERRRPVVPPRPHLSLHHDDEADATSHTPPRRQVS